MGALDIIERVEALERRTEGVDETLCRFKARPAGAPPLARLCVEVDPPTCYLRMLPIEVRDPDRRTFHPWRALRTGVDDDGHSWSLQPHHIGVSAWELWTRLGGGEAHEALLLHVARELVDAWALLADALATVAIDDEGRTVREHHSGRSLLVRPTTDAHVVFGFDGDVSLEPVTDAWRVPRSRTSAQADADDRHDLHIEHERGFVGLHATLVDVLRRLAGPSSSHYAAPLRPLLDGLLDRHAPETFDATDTSEGRRALRAMLEALFPAEAARARDLDEAG